MPNIPLMMHHAFFKCCKHSYSFPNIVTTTAKYLHIRWTISFRLIGKSVIDSGVLTELAHCPFPDHKEKSKIPQLFSPSSLEKYDIIMLHWDIREGHYASAHSQLYSLGLHGLLHHAAQFRKYGLLMTEWLIKHNMLESVRKKKKRKETSTYKKLYWKKIIIYRTSHRKNKAWIPMYVSVSCDDFFLAGTD